MNSWAIAAAWYCEEGVANRRPVAMSKAINTFMNTHVIKQRLQAKCTGGGQKCWLFKPSQHDMLRGAVQRQEISAANFYGSCLLPAARRGAKEHETATVSTTRTGWWHLFLLLIRRKDSMTAVPAQETAMPPRSEPPRSKQAQS